MKTKILIYIASILIIPSMFMCRANNAKVAKDDEKTKLQGVWGKSINENASFWIKSDSIYYPENFISYKFTTKRDSIFIQYDGWIYKGIFRFRNDSLVLKTRDKENVFIRIAK